MSALDRSHPFYRPLWRRVVLTSLVVGWAGVEIFIAKDGFWAAIAVGISLWFAWELLISWKEPAP
ncbi:MAG: DUF3329 domain-containing protein [Aestuariivirgaceae bacterium]|nr:DUF3329 domain-containing protein [Aestuariivirgaceae bacterium]